MDEKLLDFSSVPNYTNQKIFLPSLVKSIMKMTKDTQHTTDNPERRKGERRVCKDRRSETERRSDGRLGSNKPRRTLKTWIRSITNARLGVDRRKGERRVLADRRIPPRSILTKEEIHDLLSP